MSKRVVEEEGDPWNLFEYPLEHLREAGDVRLDYKSAKHPWIEFVWQAPMSYSEFQDFDQIQMRMPEGADPGHYVLQWDWNGYNDCVDIELRSLEVEFPYGKGSSNLVYKRTDHCQPVAAFSDCRACHMFLLSLLEIKLQIINNSF